VVRYGIFGLVIDPHNQVEHKRPSNMTEHEYIGDVLRKLRSFAKSYGVHIFYVAHPRKIANGEIPSLD
jgi:twinkle protein